MDQANVVFDIGKTADQHRKIESMDGNNCYAILMLSKNFNIEVASSNGYNLVIRHG